MFCAPPQLFRAPPLRLTTTAVIALAACTAVQWIPTLPPWPACLLLLAASLLLPLWKRGPGWTGVAIAICFGAWTAACGVAAMDARLRTPDEGADVTVSGRIVDLPRRQGKDASFVFVPDAGAFPTASRWRLTWYRTHVVPRACERWRFTVRLRRPRGSVNPGGSDAEKVALQRGVTALGYVRGPLPRQPLSRPFCMDGWRAALARALDDRLGAHAARIVKALAIGDSRGLDAGDWDVARSTGVSHLIAISGFHVGVAAAGGVLFIRFLYGLMPMLALRVPRHVVQAMAGLAVAGGYGMLAGMGLPTVRTLLMIGMVLTASVARRSAGGITLLAFALLCVLVVAPLSVLSAGFWLSFAGVGFLILCVTPGRPGIKAWAGELLRAQAVMSIALLPLSLWCFGSASLVGFAANLVAAPLVSFAVVPLVLAGCATLSVSLVSTPLLHAASWLLSWQWRALSVMADWPGARLSVDGGGLLPVLLATLGAAWLFAPRGVPLRGYGAVMFLPLLMPVRHDPPIGAFRAWALDVGQGLAVVVHTRRHTLVYDTGPAYGGGRDAGDGVVLPSITALGVGPVDTLVVSHGDVDHAGGAASVVARYPRARRVSGEPHRLAFDAEHCTAGDGWTWDGIEFAFLAVPLARDVKGGQPGKVSGNDRSCVLSVEGPSGRLLLTGDIGEKAERRMDPDELVSRVPTVTTVAHHGSRYSSSARWLGLVQPEIALVSAGWRNRFGHPHPTVLQRHSAVGATVVDTSGAGAVQVDFPKVAPPAVSRTWRGDVRRYWRE